MFCHRVLQRLASQNGLMRRAVTGSNKFVQRQTFSTSQVSCTVVASPYEDLALPQSNIGQHLLNESRKYGSKVAFVNGATGQEMTYDQFRDQIVKVASALTKMGIRKGDVLTLYSPNCPEFAVVYLAITALGGVVSAVNPLYTEGELAHALSHSGSKLLVTVPMLLPVAKGAVGASPSVKGIITIGEAEGCRPFANLLEDDGKSFPENVDTDPKDEVAALPYSSGTTGLPKGVMLTHYNITSNMEQIVTDKVMNYTSDDALMGVLPFFHIYGQVVVCLGGLLKGTKIVSVPKFDPEMFLQASEKYRVTYMHVVPPIALFLAKHPLVDNFDLTGVHTFFVGAAPVGGETLDSVLKRLKSKAVFRQGYGLTEASPVTNCNPTSGDVIHDSIGYPIHNTKCKIVDVVTGKELEAGQEGEFLVHGPQVMKGYFKNPEATACTLESDGWLHTGDIGYFDKSGHFYITDRLKELIKYKGFQVAPAELEALLVSNPKIQDAAVIGIPDERAGELPRAYVVLKPDVSMTEDEVHSFVKGKVAVYKELTGGVTFRSEIPKSATGKILRRKLKEELKKQ